MTRNSRARQEGALVEGERATSTLAERFGNHRTLVAGIPYAVAIIAVLAFVARL